MYVVNCSHYPNFCLRAEIKLIMLLVPLQIGGGNRSSDLPGGRRSDSPGERERESYLPASGPGMCDRCIYRHSPLS